jgi:hypothetical protein
VLSGQRKMADHKIVTPNTLPSYLDQSAAVR